MPIEEVSTLSEDYGEEQGWEGLWSVDREHSKAEFAVRYLVPETTGVFGEVAGTISLDEESPENSSVEATIDVYSLDTGRPKRDEDLLEREEFLEAERFPQITFQSTQVELSESDRMKVYGNLTIRDVTKEVTLDVQYKDHSVDDAGTHRAVFEAETELSREEFGIDWGGTPGQVVIGDAVTVRLYLEAVRVGLSKV
jgi:polyisoprenoid-binding protein YceI